MDWPVCTLQVCNLVFGKFAKAEYQKVNKDPKFDANMTWTANYLKTTVLTWTKTLFSSTNLVFSFGAVIAAKVFVG